MLFRSFLRDDAIPVPDDVEFVWLRTKVRKQSYRYEYSFDGKNYTEIPGTLDAAVLSDDYVRQSYGGFFTGAFVAVPYGTDFLFLKDFYCILLCHIILLLIVTNIPVRNELSYNYRLSF